MVERDGGGVFGSVAFVLVLCQRDRGGQLIGTVFGADAAGFLVDDGKGGGRAREKRVLASGGGRVGVGLGDSPSSVVGVISADDGSGSVHVGASRAARQRTEYCGVWGSSIGCGRFELLDVELEGRIAGVVMEVGAGVERSAGVRIERRFPRGIGGNGRTIERLCDWAGVEGGKLWTKALCS